MNRRPRSTFRRGRGSDPYLRVLAFRGALAAERRRSDVQGQLVRLFGRKRAA